LNKKKTQRVLVRHDFGLIMHSHRVVPKLQAYVRLKSLLTRVIFGTDRTK